MVQDEVGWILETLKANYPGTWPTDADGDPVLARIHRDDPKILETGQRTKSLELEKWNAIGASLADRTPTPVGTEYDHRVETTVSLRLEGLHEDEWGNIESAAHFDQIVRHIQYAINRERSYPTVDGYGSDYGESYGEIGTVAYHSLYVGENEQDLSDDHGDYFRRDFDVRLVGYSSLP